MDSDPAFSSSDLSQLAHEARRTFEAAGDRAGLSEAWRAIAEVAALHCRLGTSIAAVEKAAANSDAPHRLGGALLATAYVYGPMPVSEALERVTKDDIPPIEAEMSRAILEAMLGRFAVARIRMQTARERVIELGLRLTAPAFFLWEIETLAGDAGAAERIAWHACELLAESGSTGIRSTAECKRALSLRELGRHAEAREALAVGEGLSLGDDITNRILVPRVRALARPRR
jgi:hypothetical protein